jgi:hypothetical protein
MRQMGFRGGPGVVELKVLGWGQFGKGAMGSDGVVGSLPDSKRSVDAGQVQIAVIQLVELFLMGAMGSLDAAIQFG